VLSRIKVETSEGSVSVTASFGIATLKAGQTLTFETLVDRADKALYTAKETGRDRVCVWEE
jgi:diguanylate cyclase (GGDEF)-like protein